MCALLKRYITFSCCVHKTLNHIKNCVKFCFCIEMIVGYTKITFFAVCNLFSLTKKGVSLFLFRSFTAVQVSKLIKKCARNRSSALWAISPFYTQFLTRRDRIIWCEYVHFYGYIKCTQCYEVIFQHNVQRIQAARFLFLLSFVACAPSAIFSSFASESATQCVCECDFERRMSNVHYG